MALNNPENTRRSHSVALILGRRRRRRATIKSTLGERLVFAGFNRDSSANRRYWPSAYDAGPALKQHWTIGLKLKQT